MKIVFEIVYADKFGAATKNLFSVRIFIYIPLRFAITAPTSVATCVFAVKALNNVSNSIAEYFRIILCREKFYS